MIEDLPRRFRDVHYAGDTIRLERWNERAGAASGIEALFCDGVHPSSLTYELWGEDLDTFVGVKSWPAASRGSLSPAKT